MISESMDRKLPLTQRMGIRFHLMMCTLCTRYQKQLFFIQKILRSGRKVSEQDEVDFGLSEEGRKRIEKYLNENTGEGKQ